MINKEDVSSTNIIFDFDGTLADTLYKVVEIINRDPSRYKIDGINPVEVAKLKELSISYLLKEFNIHLFQVPALLKLIRSDLNKEIGNISFFDDMPEVLTSLKQQGYNLGVFTSNSVENVNAFLSNNNISVFDFVKSERSLLSKHLGLRHIIEERHMDKTKTYYVGDEVRDINAAKKNNITVISVTWGYNSQKLLKKHDPDYLIHTPKSILEIFEVGDMKF